MQTVPQLPLDTFRALLRDTPLGQLLEYWLGLCDGARLPARKSIDPSALKPVLPDLYVLERQEDGGLRFRLVGTAVRDLFSKDITGSTLEQVLPTQALRDSRRCYDTVDRFATPWLTRIVYDLGQGDQYRYGRLVCPLATDGQRIDAYLGAFETIDTYSPPRSFAEVEDRVQGVLARQEAVLAQGWQNGEQPAVPY